MENLKYPESTIRKIHEAIKDRLNKKGPVRMSELLEEAKSTEYSRSALYPTFRYILGKMAEEGKATKVRNGTWTILDSGAQIFEVKPQVVEPFQTFYKVSDKDIEEIAREARKYSGQQYINVVYSLCEEKKVSINTFINYLHSRK